jgi:hypothetical protein
VAVQWPAAACVDRRLLSLKNCDISTHQTPSPLRFQDMEGGCACTLEESSPSQLTAQPAPQSASLSVSSCIFHEVLAAEGEAHLLAHLCCQHNFTWLDAYRGGPGWALVLCAALSLARGKHTC